MTTDIRKNPITGQTILQIDRGEDLDMVNHPPHYTSDPSGIECIQVTRHRNFNIGNAIKYLWRAGIKDDARHIEDLKKAIFYINDEINRLEKLHGKKESH